ncbi:1,4-alpha-glucan branching protein GlgB [Desertibaculum subflavum]|uniref:1,4-alpha-glucan branching protein GlgB n=1 Tax=Desertibaculum subflavum TaxID=2268458 RepID=UPI000E66EEB4
MHPASDASSHDVQAIVNGDHPDPFAFLGLHETEDGLVVRTFLPEAAGVTVLDAKTSRPVGALERVHDAGLFAGRIERKRRLPYRLRVNWGGREADVGDPYRFPPWLGEVDLHLFGEGTHLSAYDKLGAHPTNLDGTQGVAFVVWAPNAHRVSVIGDFNNWDGRRHPMRHHPGAGLWEIFIPDLKPGDRYKYEIKAPDGAILMKADPCAFAAEHPPQTASVVADLGSPEWRDAGWLAERERHVDRSAPVSIYEVHLGSWRRKPEEGNRYLTYRELAEQLVPYVKDMGFTHIELLPISEYPFDGSWGYQPTGLFAPTSRFGTPEEFRLLIEAAHAAGLGVILDWVPGHFPTDPHGLGNFDGTHLYEHADPRQGLHKDWDTLIYNYGRREVANFLLANALFWLDRYHIDGLRVDAVASMLYLDYSRAAGEWVPNKFGGRENLEAVEFFRRLNETAYGRHPGIATVAEESTAWPMVSRPTYLGGLGFGYKWNMGWMHDTLDYISRDPVHRSHHHNQLTFGLIYAFSENFVLPLSHDEVVHGKGSLLGKMPGDRWQRFANLRAYYTFMFGHPGKKLLFMGAELAQEREWNHDKSLDWHLLEDPAHAGIQRLLRDLNALYRAVPALHARDCEPEGFEWIDANDSVNSVLSFIRKPGEGGAPAIVVCNFTPVPRHGYRLGVPAEGFYREALNSDAEIYGGGNIGNGGGVHSEPVPWHGRPHSVTLTLPPLGGVVLVAEHG